jgi:hypothetical protein
MPLCGARLPCVGSQLMLLARSMRRKRRLLTQLHHSLLPAVTSGSGRKLPVRFGAHDPKKRTLSFGPVSTQGAASACLMSGAQEAERSHRNPFRRVRQISGVSISASLRLLAEAQGLMLSLLVRSRRALRRRNASRAPSSDRPRSRHNFVS